MPTLRDFVTGWRPPKIARLQHGIIGRRYYRDSDILAVHKHGVIDSVTYSGPSEQVEYIVALVREALGEP